MPEQLEKGLEESCWEAEHELNESGVEGGSTGFLFFLLFITNPSTPHVVKEWQSSHIKLKALNFLPFNPAVFPLEHIESLPLPAHR